MAAKSAEFGRSTLASLLARAIADEDAGEPDPLDQREIRQVCYFKYQDGVPMVTVGWIVVARRDMATFTACSFDALPFVRTGSEAFKVQIPVVTPVELREMERRLPDLFAGMDLDWIPLVEREKFATIYRYLPRFSVVEDG